jgi:hypothetical protein
MEREQDGESHEPVATPSTDQPVPRSLQQWLDTNRSHPRGSRTPRRWPTMPRSGRTCCPNRVHKRVSRVEFAHPCGRATHIRMVLARQAVVGVANGRHVRSMWHAKDLVGIHAVRHDWATRSRPTAGAGSRHRRAPVPRPRR